MGGPIQHFGMLSCQDIAYLPLPAWFINKSLCLGLFEGRAPSPLLFLLGAFGSSIHRKGQKHLTGTACVLAQGHRGGSSTLPKPRLAIWEPRMLQSLLPTTGGLG